jgi:hypothetical protein|tara:strand:- start:604 stop:807 length:204 start_codon:yes stop_codon:yes gene_type:complete
MINLQSGLNKYVKLNGKVKAWLLEEISDVRKNPFHEEEDSREAGRLDGRIECAENLLEQITKWEKKK